VWAIWLHDERPPAGVESRDWLLLTNVAMATWRDAPERIGYSWVRPGTLSWHTMLTSGDSVEDGRREATARRTPYVALLGVVAWRLCWRTHGTRALPPSIAHRPGERSRPPYVKPCALSHSVAGFSGSWRR
jgi:hypothetical protein